MVTRTPHESSIHVPYSKFSPFYGQDPIQNDPYPISPVIQAIYNDITAIEKVLNQIPDNYKNDPNWYDHFFSPQGLGTQLKNLEIKLVTDVTNAWYSTPAPWNFAKENQLMTDLQMTAAGGLQAFVDATNAIHNVKSQDDMNKAVAALQADLDQFTADLMNP
ncbi:MAG: hypothetical protein HYX48_04905 [Chlamydiales bacterium]|nr:hypothetical protein [Chlamydiales bacterium]